LLFILLILFKAIEIHSRKKMPQLEIKITYEPYQQTYNIYLMHFCYSFVTRMWDMGIIFFIAELTNNSLTVVALAGFLGSFSIFLFMPVIGKWLDNTDRLASTFWALGIKLIAVTVAYLVCAFLVTDSSKALTTDSVRLVLLYSLPVLCTITSLCFSIINQAIEKDWIVVLADGDTAWLSSVNSVMSQIDLGCNSVAPAVTGLLFSYLTRTDMSIVLLISNALATYMLFSFLRHLYLSWPALAISSSTRNNVVNTVPEPVVSENNTSSSSSGHNNTTNTKVIVSGKVSTNASESTPLLPKSKSATTIINNNNNVSSVTGTTTNTTSTRVKNCLLPFLCKEIFRSGCAGVMISYAILYFTVLSFGSLMLVYTRWCGLSDHWIGLARGGASLTGFLGAFIFPFMKARLGLFNSAYLAIWYQCILVLLAGSSMFWLSRYNSMLLIVGATVSIFVILFY